MTLRLAIDNMDRLADGGPTRIEVRSHGIDIGRASHLDWTLPDPSLHVSSKHCEIRFRDGGYWLHDVSTNGTFINDSDTRVSGPYRLKNGDRLSIGPYIIAVELQGVAREVEPAQTSRPPVNIWDSEGPIAEPVSKSSFGRERQARPQDPFPISPAAISMPEPAWSKYNGLKEDPDDWMNASPPRPAREPEPIQPPRPRRPAERAEPQDWTSPPQRPAPEPAPPPIAPRPSAPPIGIGDASDMLRRLAAAAGIPERALDGRDPQAVIDDVGAVLRLTIENLTELLSARAEAKGQMRIPSGTTIRSRENNPLKFSVTTAECLARMFGPQTPDYLGARAAVAASFADIKAHQLFTGLATQAAIQDLFEELAPGSIEKSVDPERGITGLVLNRKAKLWDTFVERWRAKTKRADGRLIEAFSAAFSAAYERVQSRRN